MNVVFEASVDFKRIFCILIPKSNQCKKFFCVFLMIYHLPPNAKIEANVKEIRKTCSTATSTL